MLKKIKLDISEQDLSNVLVNLHTTFREDILQDICHNGLIVVCPDYRVMQVIAQLNTLPIPITLSSVFDV